MENAQIKPSSCQRCHDLPSLVLVRQGPLCAACYTRFLRAKILKRLEIFKAKAGASDVKTLLVPMSFGLSSVALLHFLSQFVQEREERFRQQFRLHVLHVASGEEGEEMAPETSMSLLKDYFPHHHYSVVSLADLFKKRTPEESNAHATTPGLRAFLTKLPSAAARFDAVTILRLRFIVDFAKRNSCCGIFWGHNTTQLAEKVLSESAKGRGFALPWLINDGETPYAISFYYPLRDVLRKELISYVTLVRSELKAFISTESFQPPPVLVSSRNSTIDALMKQYSESIEDNYPNILSNVAKTSRKLFQPDSVAVRRCNLCKIPVTQDQLGIQGWAGNQDGEAQNVDAKLCYGCSRTVPPEAAALLP